MSLPTEFDFALIKIGNGATPTEAFTTVCGIEAAQVNFVANTSDHFARDCAKPGKVPYRKVKTTGQQIDVTGSGLSNADTITDFLAALGLSKNYKVEGYKRDGTDTGDLIGTFSGPFVMTAFNLNISDDASGEITLASDGIVTYTAAP
jgi:predicted secreted protein